MFVQNYFNELFVVETGFWIVDYGWWFIPIHIPHFYSPHTHSLFPHPHFTSRGCSFFDFVPQFDKLPTPGATSSSVCFSWVTKATGSENCTTRT